MSSFSNKVIVVTGAAGALGQAVAKFFWEEGATVAYLDYSQEILDKTFPDQSAERSVYLPVDLTDRQSCVDGVAAIVEKCGSVDILANVAGGFLMGDTVHETSDKTWDFLFDLNTRSILNTSAAIVPLMLKQGGGKIINIAAGAAHQGKAKMGAYVASKSAVLRLTESMALELRADKINVNSILPGTIDTQRNRDDMPNADYSKWVAPSKIAEVIGFLASDAADAVHGAGVPVVGLS